MRFGRYRYCCLCRPKKPGWSGGGGDEAEGLAEEGAEEGAAEGAALAAPRFEPRGAGERDRRGEAAAGEGDLARAIVPRGAEVVDCAGKEEEEIGPGPGGVGRKARGLCCH